MTSSQNSWDHYLDYLHPYDDKSASSEWNPDIWMWKGTYIESLGARGVLLGMGGQSKRALYLWKPNNLRKKMHRKIIFLKEIKHSTPLHSCLYITTKEWDSNPDTVLIFQLHHANTETQKNIPFAVKLSFDELYVWPIGIPEMKRFSLLKLCLRAALQANEPEKWS